MKKIYMILLAAAALIAASCTVEEKQDYITLDKMAYTFSNGEDSITVAVNSTGAWEYQIQGDWITAEPVGEDSLMIRVSANEGEEPRSGKVSFVTTFGSADFLVEQFGYIYNGKFVDLVELQNAVMSRSGDFVAGMKYNVEDGSYTAVIIDTRTGEQTENSELQGFSEISSISDDGSVIVLQNSNGIESSILQNGEVVEVRVPENCDGPRISAISADGTVWVGYTQSSVDRGYVPVVWRNGEPEILDRPETDLWDSEIYSVMARGCSADGSVIYGSDWSSYGLIYWKDGKMFYPGKDFLEKKTVIIESWWGTMETEANCAITMYATSTNISPDGKYIVSDYSDYITETEGEPATEYYYAAAVNTETNELVKFMSSDTGIASTAGITADNNGIMFGATPAQGVAEGLVFNLNDMTSYTVPQWFEQTYGIQMGADRIVTQVSPDNNVYLGWKAVPTALGMSYKSWYFIVDMDKHLAQ